MVRCRSKSHAPRSLRRTGCAPRLRAASAHPRIRRRLFTRRRLPIAGRGLRRSRTRPLNSCPAGRTSRTDAGTARPPQPYSPERGPGHGRKGRLPASRRSGTRRPAVPHSRTTPTRHRRTTGARPRARASPTGGVIGKKNEGCGIAGIQLERRTDLLVLAAITKQRHVDRQRPSSQRVRTPPSAFHRASWA